MVPKWLICLYHDSVLNIFIFCTGFSEIMATLARIGLFDAEAHPLLEHESQPTFRTFLCKLLKIDTEAMDEAVIGEKEITERIVKLGHCKERGAAVKAAKTIM